MSIKDIIVSVDFAETGLERMRFALDIAQSHGARVMAYYTPTTASVSLEGTPDEIAEATEIEFDKALEARDLQGVWTLSDDPLVDDLVAQIRCADLAVLGLGSPETRRAGIEGFRIADVVRAAGRPILGVPISRLTQGPFKRILVAWDGSREATRALHDALPLLRDSESIAITAIGSADRSGPQRIVEHLARHGLAAHVDTTPSYEADVGAELLQRAAMREVDLVVAGAYGRSKLAEDLLGGASDALLHQMLVPILLSH